MERKKTAVIFGGNSTEYEVSLQSAYAVLTHLDSLKYDIIPIGITRKGEWYHYRGETEKIADNTWISDRKNLHPILFSPDPSVKGFLGLEGDAAPSPPPCVWIRTGPTNWQALRESPFQNQWCCRVFAGRRG